MDEKKTVTPYETPALVELGEFGEDTLGHGEEIEDWQAYFG
ncbi:lasso RiPP family leader peptide-containing protein [Saccharothrix xinjiangensis]|uniref:Lasso RiPP family leader peptide-containing protein n=1 Tax=Saccharothrix xinjiangensis TaxID=204798 RepID=A0ABV9Y2G2_9PSEU